MVTSDEVKTETKSANLQNYHSQKSPMVVIAALVVAAAIFGFGLVLGHVLGRFSTVGYGGRPPIVPGAPNYRAGLRSASSSKIRIEGVVTAVNGSSITVAGHGATNTVTTNSSTQYVGGSQPKVNDTVVALGSISNDTFTATQISINL